MASGCQWFCNTKTAAFAPYLLLHIIDAAPLSLISSDSVRASWIGAQGKFYPFRDTFRRFHLMTVPLSPARAALLLGGAAKHMGYDTYQVPS